MDDEQMEKIKEIFLDANASNIDTLTNEKRSFIVRILSTNISIHDLSSGNVSENRDYIKFSSFVVHHEGTEILAIYVPVYDRVTKENKPCELTLRLVEDLLEELPF
jgi:hypothetical protein